MKTCDTSPTKGPKCRRPSVRWSPQVGGVDPRRRRRRAEDPATVVFDVRDLANWRGAGVVQGAIAVSAESRRSWPTRRCPRTRANGGCRPASLPWWRSAIMARCPPSPQRPQGHGVRGRGLPQGRHPGLDRGRPSDRTADRRLGWSTDTLHSQPAAKGGVDVHSFWTGTRGPNRWSSPFSCGNTAMIPTLASSTVVTRSATAAPTSRVPFAFTMPMAAKRRCRRVG